MTERVEAAARVSGPFDALRGLWLVLPAPRVATRVTGRRADDRRRAARRADVAGKVGSASVAAAGVASGRTPA